MTNKNATDDEWNGTEIKQIHLQNMTCNQIGIAAHILEEHWGPVVADVGLYLMKSGPCHLPLIVKGIKKCGSSSSRMHTFKLKDLWESMKDAQCKSKVKSALIVLIQHHFVTFEASKQKMVVYKIHVDKILLVLRYPRYMLCCKQMFGNAAELICKHLLMHGQATMSSMLIDIFKQLQSSESDESVSFHSIHNVFSCLVDAHFIHRSLEVESATFDSMPHLVCNTTAKYKIPEISIALLSKQVEHHESQQVEPPRKKPKLDNEGVSDSGIYWQLDIDRLHQLLRDQLFVSAVGKSVGGDASELVRLMLLVNEKGEQQWSATSKTILRTDLISKLEKETKLKSQEIDKYLALLKDDSTRFVHKVADGQGGTYQLQMKDMITSIVWATVESIVMERFGPKCSRIFGLLKVKKYLEQMQIEQMVLIPKKIAKEMIYRLLLENYIQFQEIPKTPDYAPAKTFYLFNINLPQVARMVLENSYKAVFNLKCREECELKENKRVVEKKQRVDAILSSMQLQGADVNQLHEVEELITPPEQMQIQRLDRICQKLQFSELELDNTIFILQMYFKFAPEQV